MHILNLSFSLTLLATVCVARPTSNVDFKKDVVEKLNAAPTGWVKDASAKLDKDSTSITLKIHLVNQDMDKFHDLAMNIATPGHAQYGKHLDHETILAMIAPKQESNDLVMQWLKDETEKSEAEITMKGDYVTVQASVTTIEKLLDAEYSVFGKSWSKALLSSEYSQRQCDPEVMRRPSGLSDTASLLPSKATSTWSSLPPSSASSSSVQPFPNITSFKKTSTSLPSKR